MTFCSSIMPEERRNMRTKIPENKKLTNQLQNIRKIKHHLYLQNRIEIQDNRSKDTSMELVNNRENSNKISTSEHLTKSTNHKTEAAEIQELNSTPAILLKKQLLKAFIMRLIKKIRMLQLKL